jgi:hypothetical protein
VSNFVLINSEVRQNAIKAVVKAQDGWLVSVSEPKRTTPQNRHFHALCGDIAKSGMKWAGKTRSLEEWKALLVSAHSVATGKGGEVVPGLEGEFVAIRESTSRMPVSRAASLIEYTLAFALTNGVELKETQSGGFMDLAARTGG